MESYYTLEKDKLISFLRATMKDFRLIAPQSANGKDFLLQEIQDLDKINLDYDITSNTLKEFFFPRQETIFTYQRNEGSKLKIMSIQERLKETIFFGVRSCDVRAVYFEDCFFSREPKDNLYWRKREKGILISFACNKPPRHSCFCVYTKSGPFLEKNQGFDLQFIDLANKYLVEIGTTKGNDLIKKYKRLFSLANKDTLNKKLSLQETCLKEFEQKYDILLVYEKLKNINLEELWDELGKRCTNCGGCEFICPTCFCFYTQDIDYSKNRGERLRAWDSCTFSGYSRMSGDINPHEKNSDRISRRFFCKLFNVYNWCGIFGCTGCGRCSFVCPVNLDMESFIASLMKTNQYQPLLKEL